MGMGVAGLLEALAVEAEEVVWPGKVRGAAIGIDISVWLHELATRHYRNASRLRDWALRGRERRTGGVFDLESTLGRRLGVKRDLELTLKSVKNLRCAESST